MALHSCSTNARKVVVDQRPPGSLFRDPTRTLMLRKRFFQAFSKRFARMKGEINRLLVDEDVMGMKRANKIPIGNLVTHHGDHDQQSHDPTGGGGGGIKASVSDSLTSMSYEGFSDSSDPKQFVEESLKTIATDLGLDVGISVLSDTEFDRFVADAASKAGIHPSQVRAVYKGDQISFRGRIVDAIETPSDFRLFTNEAYHELGHAYQKQSSGVRPDQIKSVQQYNASKTEEFANAFSSRMSLASKHVRGLRGGRELREGKSVSKYLSETSV